MSSTGLPLRYRFRPACPSCGDLCEPGALICECGAKTTLVGLDPRQRRRYRRLVARRSRGL